MSFTAMGLTAKDVVNFVKEALLMKDFNHMNVLKLIGIVYEPADPDGLPLVITPLMEKGDLKTLISDEFYVSGLLQLILLIKKSFVFILCLLKICY